MRSVPDQNHPNFNCRTKTPTERATAILQHIASFDANVVTLQEVCQTTFAHVQNALSLPWTGYFKHTVVLSSTDNRCQTLPGQPRYWGTSAGCVQETGNGRFVEADLPHAYPGDGTYDEDTFSWEKLDYVFFNPGRFWSDYGGDAVPTAVSDHDPLRGATTVHD